LNKERFALYLSEKERKYFEDFSESAKSVSGRKSQKVSVRYLSGPPIGREPLRDPVRYLFGQPRGCEPSRAPVCEDFRKQK